MVLPCSFSFFKNRFKSKKSFETICSLNSLNQLSSKVSISSFSSSFVSSCNLLTHASLSHLAGVNEGIVELAVEVTAVWRDGEDVSVIFETVDSALPDMLGATLAVFGGPKKEVIVPFTLGFFADTALSTTALRLADIVKKTDNLRGFLDEKGSRRQVLKTKLMCNLTS